jgi:hypothetical protein
MQQANKQRWYATHFYATDSKHVPAATTTNTTPELPLETVFYTRSVQSGYKEDNWGNPVGCQLRVEFCMGGCEDKTWACEAEESPLLKSLPGNGWRHSRLERGLEGAVVICSVQISDSAVITCRPEWWV